MTEAKAPARFPVGLTIATAIAFAILCALGVWQVQRLAWKTELLRQIETRSTAPPAALERVLARADGEDLGFYRVQVVCPGLDTAPFLQLYALKDGQAGSRLISACPLAEGENQWSSRDVAAMAQALGARDPAPVFLLAETPTNPDFPALQPAPLPGEIPNRHLEYALTWFGLAGALIAVYAAMLWRRWKS